MNPMKEAWNLLKGNPSYQANMQGTKQMGAGGSLPQQFMQNPGAEVPRNRDEDTFHQKNMASQMPVTGPESAPRRTFSEPSTQVLVKNAHSKRWDTQDSKSRIFRDNQNKDSFNEGAIISNNNWLNEPKKQVKVKTTEPHTLSTLLKVAFLSKGE